MKFDFMNLMFVASIIITSIFTSCNGQIKQNASTVMSPKSFGGAFENSDFTYYNIPKAISSIDTVQVGIKTDKKFY